MITIRQATYTDIPRIMRFIDEHWKKGHIMAVDRDLFEFQHVDPVTGEVTYLIAEDDDENHTIYGTMGYILCNHSETPDVFTTMIKTLQNSENRMLGEEISDQLRESIGIGAQIGVGVNPRYAKVIRGLHEDHVGLLRFWYRLCDRGSYSIAAVHHFHVPKPLSADGIRLVHLADRSSIQRALQGFPLEREQPYRDEAYILHRYVEHPYYQYDIYSVTENDKTSDNYVDAANGQYRGLLVTRILSANGSRCLRIMDWYGEDHAFSHLGSEIDRLMAELNCEYTDMACYGMPEGIMKEAGFLDAAEMGNIIPDHFEPFEQSSVDVYVYSNRLSGLKLFKAFADQDRPNTIRTTK